MLNSSETSFTSQLEVYALNSSDLSPVSTFGDDGKVVVPSSDTGNVYVISGDLVVNADGSLTITYGDSSNNIYTITLSSTGQVETMV